MNSSSEQNSSLNTPSSNPVKINILSFNVEGISLEDRLKHSNNKESYLSEKKRILKNFLLSSGAEIICLQEFTNIIRFELTGYHSLLIGDLVIMFNPNYIKYIRGEYHPKIGLIGYFNHLLTGIKFWVATARWTPYKHNRVYREESFQATCDFLKDKTGIFIGDTNARNGEIQSNDILIDAHEEAVEKSGTYTIDKKENHYFEKEPLLYQSRFDRCYITKDIVCLKSTVCGKEKYNELKPLSVSGCLSDHYALMVSLTKIIEEVV